MAPVSIIRATGYHFERLLFVKQKLHNNTIETAMNQLSPKVFFKKQALFKQHVNSWKISSLFKVIKTLLNTELNCKSNYLSANILCERSLLSLSSGYNKN